MSNTVALGALSPDAISSTVYGPEQIMVELLPAAGMAAYVLVLPIAGVILLILALVTGSYRQVVMAYTAAGRFVCGGASQFRATDCADLVGGAVDRLRGHRGGAVRVGHVRGGVGGTVARPLPLGNHRGGIATDFLCQPARDEGGGPDLRRAGVLVHHHARGDDRDRCGSPNLLGFTAIRFSPHCRGGAGPSGQRADHGRDGTGVVARVRQRRHVADRSRGDRRRGECLSKAAGSQRPSGVDAGWPASSGFCWWVSSTWCTPPTPLPTSPNIRRCFPRSPVRSSATA